MIKQIGNEECRIAAELAVLLWPGDEIDEVEKDLKEYINSNAGAIFIYLDDSMPVGFAQCGLKNDYVEGTESTPVGYLEGILVKAEHQKRGIARKLLKECEEWAKGQGCIEFASDCELNNFENLKFHLRVGFREANRIICFTKKL